MLIKYDVDNLDTYNLKEKGKNTFYLALDRVVEILDKDLVRDKMFLIIYQFWQCIKISYQQTEVRGCLHFQSHELHQIRYGNCTQRLSVNAISCSTLCCNLLVETAMLLRAFHTGAVFDRIELKHYWHQ